jgi:hypothetical protein
MRRKAILTTGVKVSEMNIKGEWTRKEIVEEHGGVERQSNGRGLKDKYGI